jgi:hypothetical protein
VVVVVVVVVLVILKVSGLGLPLGVDCHDEADSASNVEGAYFIPRQEGVNAVVLRYLLTPDKAVVPKWEEGGDLASVPPVR